MKIALVADLHYSHLLAEHEGGLKLAETKHVAHALVEALNRRPPDCVIWVGDVTHEGTPQVRTDFAKIVSQVRSPNVVMIGNHDVERVTSTEFGATQGIYRQSWFTGNGWNVILADTVRQLSPHDVTGELRPELLSLLSAAAAETDAPMLVISHHPLTPEWLNTGAYLQHAARPGAGGVHIGGHTHLFRSTRVGDWLALELGGVTVAPWSYAELTLAPGKLELRRLLLDDVNDGHVPEAYEAERVEVGSTEVRLGADWRT